MLPWGVQTAEELTEALYFHTPSIKKFAWSEDWGTQVASM